MPRVGGNGPFRRGPVLSNNSSGDEAAGGSLHNGGGKQAWQGSEEQQSDQATNALFEQYLRIGCEELGDDLGRDQVFQQGLSRIRDHLTHVDSSCCLICLNHIRPTEAVWHCEKGCFTVLHLVCIQEWARSQVQAARSKAAARSLHEPADAAPSTVIEWGCPKCRCTYAASDVPRQYKCFCGKVTNPEFDPWITPHSCGEICGRQLSGGCGHTCLLLCHPGPCPPCPLVVDARCYCGRRCLKRRCGHHEYSCDGVCGSELDCGHRCPDVCHPGDCNICHIMGKYSCHCRAESRRLQCGDRNFQCTRVCMKPLVCGNHKCEEVCHAGACSSCPFSGVRTCPCGNKTYDGMSCADKVPTCGETCGKLLPCGVHRCADRCHHGDCTAQCRGPALKTCRCGKSQKEVLCFQEFSCERRCTEMRVCGRHPCKRRCCDGNCPPCEEVCGRRLKCGNHKCPAPCHSGPCRPCPLTVVVTCACGTASCALPCGAESKAEPPHCVRPCLVPRICRHSPQLPPHRCHFGPCPPCTLSCATPLACLHSCTVGTCHDPSPPAVPDFKPPPPPPKAAVTATAAAAVLAMDNSGTATSGEFQRRKRGTVPDAAPPAPAVQEATLEAARILAAVAKTGEFPSACPPCRHPVEEVCVGGHGSAAMPCCQRQPYRCNALCGRPLQCGNHTCSLPCHAIKENMGSNTDAVDDINSQADPRVPLPCRQCNRACSRSRGCSHGCPLKCHLGPCPRCELKSRVACLCGKTMLQLPCYKLTAAKQMKCNVDEPSPLLSCEKPCHRQLAYCPHPCKVLCHSSPCPDPGNCSVEVSVRCACPNKRRAKWKCSEVQAALQRAGKPRTYDDTQAPRLLPCDADCEEAKVKAAAAVQARSGISKLNSMLATSQSMESLTDGGGVAVVTAQAGKTRMTRAEREALAVKKEMERRKKERNRAILRGVMTGAVVLLGLLLAWSAQVLLAWLDRKMHQKWALERAPQ